MCLRENELGNMGAWKEKKEEDKYYNILIKNKILKINLFHGKYLMKQLINFTSILPCIY